ncbi:MAG: phospho-N-acetylmuramoyl-pentapeptide-transferase [Firmicutes bacterium]|nr:phospho-N-acetylmuramoyl-pentapeptide-transferase [Bacillota bacterium]
MYPDIIKAALAAGSAIIISVFLGLIMIPWLTRLHVGQSIREEGPQGHYAKAGTPTMGGLIIISACMVASLLWAGGNSEAVIAGLIMLAFGAVGFWDDYIKVVLKRSLGLRAREKLALQLLIGLIFGWFMVYYLGRGTEIFIPFSGNSIDLGYLYFPFVVLVFMATANGANLTDGLDGLAVGVTFFIAVALGVICVITTHLGLLIFSAALAGACLGFMVFNRHPAQIFMGDTGSMALGGAVAAIAAISKAEIALVLIAGIYVIETLSVIIQVISFQAARKRVFLMAPLHHHFEVLGWSETTVVKRFWMGSMLFAIFGLMGFMNWR